MLVVIDSIPGVGRVNGTEWYIIVVEGGSRMKKVLVFGGIALAALVVLIIAGGMLKSLVGHDDSGGSGGDGDGTVAGKALPGLTIDVLDVGQGDSIFIEEGETEILIDGGTAAMGARVVDDIKGRVQGKLEVVVATHKDADHVGGLTDVLRGFEVGQVWWNGDVGDSAAFRNFQTQLALDEVRGTTDRIVRRGDVLWAGGNLLFSILNPTGISGSSNDNGVVMNLMYGVTDFLFEADVSDVVEKNMLAAGVLPTNVNLLKVGHHGSKTSSCSEFLDRVRPKVAVYSCGVGNSYGFPTQEALKRLESTKATIYGTDVNGTVTATSDGASIKVNGKKGDPVWKPVG